MGAGVGEKGRLGIGIGSAVDNFKGRRDKAHDACSRLPLLLL